MGEEVASLEGGAARPGSPSSWAWLPCPWAGLASCSFVWSWRTWRTFGHFGGGGPSYYFGASDYRDKLGFVWTSWDLDRGGSDYLLGFVWTSWDLDRGGSDYLGNS